jgi:hypothetical protein
MVRDGFVKLNHRGMAELIKSGGVARDIERRAQQVAAAARSAAPVGETGNYQASIQVVMDDHPTRAAAHVMSDVPYAMIIESRLGVLARALDAAR